MKISISVPGRFHLFNLAQELIKKDYLSQLITSYPKFEVKKYGIPERKIFSIISKEILMRGWEKFPNFLKNIWNPQFFIHEVFDKNASRKLRECDIFIGGSSVSLHTFQKAKKFNAILVLERGSSHIEYQRDILREEYGKFGVDAQKPFMLPHPKIVEKELREYKEADFISVPSLFVKKTFLEKGIPESKLIHVPYGVDLSKFRQIKKEDDIFRVIFVGGISLRKGVHYLLQAFSELNLPNSELLLIGGMNDEVKPFFKRYEGTFKYVGHVLHTDLYKHLSSGSVFAMMSIEEGLALVIPQAMACGLPVIATTNTGAEDIVRDEKDGFIIPIHDVKKLKEKIVHLYENPGICRAMGQSAKERVSSGFTWDDYGGKIIKEYERVLKEKRL